MTPLDQYLAYDGWRKLLVVGTGDALDQLMRHVDELLDGAGWRRDTDWEQAANRPRVKFGITPHMLNRMHGFVQVTTATPVVRLTLNQGPRRLRGMSASLTTDDAADADRMIAVGVRTFLHDVFDPALAAVGLRRAGRFVNSRVSEATVSELVDVAELAGRRLPLDAEAEAAWQRFVLAAYQDYTSFDTTELTAWLTSMGWTAGDAASLVRRYLSETQLLRQFEGVRMAPPPSGVTTTTTAPPGGW